MTVVRKIVNHDSFMSKCHFLGSGHYYSLEEVYTALNEASPDRNKSIMVDLKPGGEVVGLFHFMSEIEVYKEIKDTPYGHVYNLQYYIFSIVIDNEGMNI